MANDVIVHLSCDTSVSPSSAAIEGAAVLKQARSRYVIIDSEQANPRTRYRTRDGRSAFEVHREAFRATTTMCWPRGTGAAQAWAITTPSTPATAGQGSMSMWSKSCSRPTISPRRTRRPAFDQRLVMAVERGDGEAVAVDHLDDPLRAGLVVVDRLDLAAELAVVDRRRQHALPCRSARRRRSPPGPSPARCRR